MTDQATVEELEDYREQIRGEIQYALEATEAEVCRRSLFHFIRKTWDVVEPGRTFCDNWHIRALCNVLQRVSRGELRKVVINVPPGTMKSLITSVFWPAWEWASDPTLRIFTASYGQHLSTRDNLKVRDIVLSPWYRTFFPDTMLSGDQNQKTLFNTTEKGWRFATSVGGSGTGEHPHRIVIDDPLSAEDARSEPERSRAKHWFDATISTRGVIHNVAIVLIMQRLHEDDLTAHVLTKDGWEHVMFPMHFDPSRADPRDPRTVAGQLLWPEMFTPEKVRNLEIDLNAYGAAGQLEQAPAPIGGGLFKEEWFEIVDAVPRGGSECRGWDTAATEAGTGSVDPDYTVGVKMKDYNKTIYIMDVARGQWSPANVDAKMMLNTSLDGRSCAQREEKEPGASGKTVIAVRARMLRGYNYAGVQISADKVTRCQPFRAACERREVKLLRGDWNKAYLRELCNFPVGKNDDQVDASSCAYNYLTLASVASVEAVWG